MGTIMTKTDKQGAEAPCLAERLAAFVRDHCCGREYDSCVTSPCRYASGDGCQHPQHSQRMANEDAEMV